jgi:hypothetical protein
MIRNIWTRLTRKQKVLIFVLVFVVMSSIILGPAPMILIFVLFSAVYAGVTRGAAHNWCGGATTRERTSAETLARGANRQAFFEGELA